MLKLFKFFSLIFLPVVLAAEGSTEYELPNCDEDSTPGLVIVSTIDGVISAVNAKGQLQWHLDTGPGPLLTSNIHNLELSNNGQWIRIIPSLTGSLYRFDGVSIDPISITASSLLRSSLKYSDDLIIAGGLEVRTYSVAFRTGKLFYTCSAANCINITNSGSDLEDVLLVERTTQTVRAVEHRSGYERWNFSVATNNITLPRISCSAPNTNLFQWNITAIVPDGILFVNSAHGNIQESWTYDFKSPIVRIWKWNGHKLSEVDLFKLRADASSKELGVSPSIYLGMHQKQLYIHESLEQQNQMQGISLGLIKNLAKIPWKPFPASDVVTEDDSTALSVLYSSGYVNGHGYFLYSEQDHEHRTNGLCGHNGTLKFASIAGAFIGNTFDEIVLSWVAAFVVLITTAILFNVMFRQLTRSQGESEVIFVERHVEVPVPSEDSPGFQSRYLTDFDTLQCLGKGGFGVVFKVKQKIDECHYAIKRTVLPTEESKRDAVMREVKALAKLDHANIVRYFNSWVETPPLDWQKNHDKEWISNEGNEEFTVSDDNEEEDPSNVSSINHSSSISSVNAGSTAGGIEKSEDSSFIVFESSGSNKDNATFQNDISESPSIAAVSSEGTQSVAVNWHRPSRRYHSINPETPPAFLYIQMQLCQKHSLKEWLKAHEQRNKDDVLDIFKQILSAVIYVHLQGLIHRDLKPSNIFFSLDGKVKVGDFGLVTDEEQSHDSTNSPSQSSSHTREVGTRLYMSPEQLKGQKYNYKVDIYSLGLIFFELLVYFGTDMERIKTISNVRIDHFPKEFKMKYPAEHKLLTLMLCASPGKRLSALEVSAALR